MLLLIPLFGLLQLAGGTSNDCGARGRTPGRPGHRRPSSTATASPFEGRGAPGGTTDFIALGEQVFTGQVVAAANCQSCHGAQGQGVSAPPLTTVRATFSSCVDHVEWVTKGTQGFQNEGRSTYGDLNKPVGGGGNMPGFGATLTPEQIGAAAAFERVRFGGVAARGGPRRLRLGPTGAGAGAPAARRHRGARRRRSTAEGAAAESRRLPDPDFSNSWQMKCVSSF